MAYIASKAGLLGLTRSLALALAPDVQVNGIAPGSILPPPRGEDDYFASAPERVPLGRTGTPEEIAEAAVYLLKSDYVTGEVIRVTGGEHL